MLNYDSKRYLAISVLDSKKFEVEKPENCIPRNFLAIQYVDIYLVFLSTTSYVYTVVAQVGILTAMAI